MIQSGSIPAFVQCLVDAGLIGAERAAALQHQHDLAGVGFAERPGMGRILVNGSHLSLPVPQCRSY